MNDEYPKTLAERDGFIVYQDGDKIVIANEDYETKATVPLCGCSAVSLATLVLPVFLAGWNSGLGSGQRIARANMISAVRTITDVLKSGGLIPAGD